MPLRVKIQLGTQLFELDGDVGAFDAAVAYESWIEIVTAHLDGLPASATAKLDQILAQVNELHTQGVTAMATVQDVRDKLAELQTSVEAETDIVTSVETLLTGQTAMLVALKQQLADAIAANDPAALQAVVDAIDTIATTNTRNAAATVAAVIAHTPAEEEPIP